MTSVDLSRPLEKGLRDFFTHVRGLAEANGLKWSQETMIADVVVIPIHQVHHRAHPVPTDLLPDRSSQDLKEILVPRCQIAVSPDPESTSKDVRWTMSVMTPPAPDGTSVPMIRSWPYTFTIADVDVTDETSCAKATGMFAQAFEMLSTVAIAPTRSDVRELIEVLEQHMEELHDRSGRESSETFLAFYATFEPLVRLVSLAEPALAEERLRFVLDRFRGRAKDAARASTEKRRR